MYYFNRPINLVKGLLKRLKDLTKRSVLLLLMVVFLSSSILILINYFTIKTLSAVRAYTHGESQYSKGQKDAARFLILFVTTGDAYFWNSFHKELAVPIGDSLARIAITSHAPPEQIAKGFLAGRNHPDDIPNLVWLFENFHSISFMNEAISIWTDADRLIGEEYRLGEIVYSKMSHGLLQSDERESVINRINEITTELTLKEMAFDSVLGSASRWISQALFIVNIVMTFIIIGSSGAFAIVMVGRLNKKNSDLMATNQELDRFVYSASHDLRAPITSLKGLIEILKLEDQADQMPGYLKLMEESLNKQDQFIKDIIDFSRNKRKEIQISVVSLKTTIEDAIAQHRYIEKDICFETDFQADKITTDPQRLSIVLNNLISNAIKYSDPKKSKRKISVKTYFADNCVNVAVEDNGIGILTENLEKVFGMFFVTDHSSKGTGLGLYITRETVEKLKGTIDAKSEFGQGSVFIVKLSLNNGNKK